MTRSCALCNRVVTDRAWLCADCRKGYPEACTPGGLFCCVRCGSPEIPDPEWVCSACRKLADAFRCSLCEKQLAGGEAVFRRDRQYHPACLDAFKRQYLSLVKCPIVGVPYQGLLSVEQCLRLFVVPLDSQKGWRFRIRGGGLSGESRLHRDLELASIFFRAGGVPCPLCRVQEHLLLGEWGPDPGCLTDYVCLRCKLPLGGYFHDIVAIAGDPAEKPDDRPMLGGRPVKSLAFHYPLCELRPDRVRSLFGWEETGRVYYARNEGRGPWMPSPTPPRHPAAVATPSGPAGTVPCYVLVDCSARARDHAEALGKGVSALVQALNTGVGAHGTQLSLSLVACGPSGGSVPTPRPLPALQPVSMSCGGELRLTGSVQQIERVCGGAGGPRGLVVVVLVSEPTDGASALAGLKRLRDAGRANVVVVGVGDAVGDATVTAAGGIALRAPAGALVRAFAWVGEVVGGVAGAVASGAAGKPLVLPPPPPGCRLVG